MRGTSGYTPVMLLSGAVNRCSKATLSSVVQFSKLGERQKFWSRMVRCLLMLTIPGAKEMNRARTGHCRASTCAFFVGLPVRFGCDKGAMTVVESRLSVLPVRIQVLRSPSLHLNLDSPGTGSSPGNLR
ncbi:hypothetical protein D3C73_1041050 [compost metagenome]